MVACIAKKVKDANLVQYEEALERVEGWQDDLARVGPDHLPCLYGEMIDFLKVEFNDVRVDEVMDSVDILSAQCGNAKIRTENKGRIKAFIAMLVGAVLPNSSCTKFADHSCPSVGHGPCYLEKCCNGYEDSE